MMKGKRNGKWKIVFVFAMPEHIHYSTNITDIIYIKYKYMEISCRNIYKMKKE